MAVQRIQSNVCVIFIFAVILMCHLDAVHCYNSSYCEGAQNCGDCIALDPLCTWCTQKGYEEFGSARCNTALNHTGAGCLNITDPGGSYNVIAEDPLGDAGTSPINRTVQVSPQAVKLTLRKGKPETVTLNVRPAEDYPLDLYFVMDLSHSMSDDLINLRSLGGRLARELQLLSSDVTMGFGSFVDKVTMPFVFTDPVLLKEKCADCDRGFGFRNNLPLNLNLSLFSDKLMEATYSSSATAPEGGLDGMMQIAVCKEKIGWRDSARHFLVYSSDNSFHIAGDASIAQIFTPNDGECHLDPVNNEYAKSTLQDFPSIGHLNEKILDGNIFSIFAVLENVYQLYTKLSKNIRGSTVGILAADSGNVINIIKSQYKAITSKVELIDTAPEEITVHYTAHCRPGDTQAGVSVCTGLSLGETVSFDIEITASECISARPGDTQVGVSVCTGLSLGETVSFDIEITASECISASFVIKPIGFEETLTVNVDVLCSCDCEKNKIPNSEYCNDGNGALSCGICECNPGSFGKTCQCTGDIGSVDDISSCIPPNSDSDTATVCSGRGECDCGVCQCFTRKDSNEVVSGPFCQCDNFSCDRFEGELCGGEQRGTCVCDEKTWTSTCQCHKGFTGSACQCPDTTDQCMASTGLLCNGFGDCVCGQCQCDPDESFRGPSCEECGICVGDCGLYRECVLCKVFDQGRLSPEQCAMCGMLIVVEETLILYNQTVLCEIVLPNNCTVKYFYETLLNGTVRVTVQKEPVCPKKGSQGVNILHVSIYIIVAIIIIGLILVLLFKLYIWHLDKKEWAEFEKSRKEEKWGAYTSPIYKPSTTKHTNPMYGKTVQMQMQKADKEKNPEEDFK